MTEVVALVPARQPRLAAPEDLPSLPGVSVQAQADFAELYRATFTDLSGYCRALLRDETAAADCAQEAFTRLFARWRAVRDPRSFLFLVATNLVRDEWRRTTRTQRLAHRLQSNRVETVELPDTTLADLVARLPDRLAQAVALHYFADLPIEEVARVVHRPAGTVKRWLHEARGLLQAALAETS